MPLTEQQKLESVAGSLALCISDTLKQALPGFGFALSVYKFNQTNFGHFISNGQRDTMIEALKELVDRLEKDRDRPAGSSSLH